MAVVADEAGNVSLTSGNELSHGAREFAKRVRDVVLSLCLLLLLSPVFLLIGLIIWCRHGVWPLYGHDRIGRNGRTFRCWKFRTMSVDSEARLKSHLASSPTAAREWSETRKLKADPRILGNTGRFLRRSSLDELPQFWNVLVGEMSLVGPRPVVADELAHYGGLRGWYLGVRPGITGPWQVGGRSETSYAARVSLDVAYARMPSLRRDAAILLRTLAVPFAQRGAC